MKSFFNQLLFYLKVVLPSFLARDHQCKLFLTKLYSKGFDFEKFQQLLHYTPKNWKLFVRALTHRSYLQTVSEKCESNERLEFLGDSILNFVVAEYLYGKYPDMDVGELSKLRARLVNRKVLAERSRVLSIADFLFMSESAAQSLDSGADSIVSDAFEAIVGAIYLDGGYKAVKKFIHKNLLENEEVISCALNDDNYKSALLEYAQANAMGCPKYHIIREDGPEHNRWFTVKVTINNETLGIGSGRNKKDAEQAAAAEALKNITRKETEQDGADKR